MHATAARAHLRTYMVFQKESQLTELFEIREIFSEAGKINCRLFVRGTPCIC